LYEDGVGDYRGSYSDGAYYAAAEPSPEALYGTDNENREGKDPQLAYFDSILSRYEILRDQLQQTPPPEALQRLNEDHPVHIGRLNVSVARWWRWKIKTADPIPAQLASMDKSTVLKLLGLLTEGTLMKRGKEIEIFVSRWAWGLLARLPDRGQLTSEEIGIVRELGKKAVLLGMGLKGNTQWDEGMDEVDAGYDEVDYEETVIVNDPRENDIDGLEPLGTSTHNGPIGPQLPTSSGHAERIISGISADILDITDNDVDTGSIPDNHTGNNEAADISDEAINSSEGLAAMKARLLNQLNEDDLVGNNLEGEIAIVGEPLGEGDYPKPNTRATVDMIITVVGEIYGQRDLLEFREIWA
jgi:hypothetical protein